ncbi:hypothetical protein [Synechococcus sp. PCC 7336]|uniref:hypothetical protein n=1 Tax=Synechococcus sp. PCC 7336 TaxID=195250 RepID=UPI0003449C0B|nr:hypothetical protein [Synechococcus sp. PCC 7336]
MLDFPSISKRNPPFPPYLNFQTLRDSGVDHLQALAGDLWTDYNLHDPGVTILEVLCYAITDLGYRINFDIADLLALDPADPSRQESNFFTADRILSCNPVTELDFRKRLIDIPGVRNAWLEKLETYEPDIYVDTAGNQLQYIPPLDSGDAPLQLHPRGIYNVLLDLDREQLPSRTEAEAQAAAASVVEQVKRVLCAHRNLCEDFNDPTVLGEEAIALCADIELSAAADPEDVLVDIFVKVQEFLAPRLRFYTLQELLARGKSPADIFAGRPSALFDARSAYDSNSNGFIDTEELAKLTPPDILYTSDLYQVVMDVPGVVAIRKLNIINYIDGLPQSLGHPWHLHLSPSHRPVLGLEESSVTFFKGDLPVKADAAEVERRFFEQQAAYIKAPRRDAELDLPIPSGTYADLADHYSIHHEFPLTYGISRGGLPASAPSLRKAQAKQLQGYLIFFDQILANYFAQLASIRDLFSWESDGDRFNRIDPETLQHRQRTYFTQALDKQELPALESLLRNCNRCPTSDLEGEEPLDYSAVLDAIAEDPATYVDRRNRFLDHLLARFAETFTDYVLLNYQIDGGQRDDADIIESKTRFLQQYPDISRDRFRAFDYCDCDGEVWDSDNISGFKRRVAGLLGIADPKRRTLGHYDIALQPERFALNLTGGFAEQPKSLATSIDFPSAEDAAAAIDTFLRAAIAPESYRCWDFNYYHHYGWAVNDRDRERLAVLERDPAFLNKSDASAELEQLLPLFTDAVLAGTGESGELPDFVFVSAADDGGLQFRLEIPLPETAEFPHTVAVFSSWTTYATVDEAIAAAEAALDRIVIADAYERIRLRRDDAASREEGTAEVFTHYGFALVDELEMRLAEWEERFGTEADRDLALYCWLASLQCNGKPLGVETPTICQPEDAAYSFEILDSKGDRVWLGQSIFASEAAADAAAMAACDMAQVANSYVPVDRDSGTCPYSFLLSDGQGQPIAEHPTHYPTEAERDRAIERLRLLFADPLTGFEIASDEGEPELLTVSLPAANFCLFEDCDPEQQAEFSTGPLVSASLPAAIFNLAQARTEFLNRLGFALDDAKLVRLYDNDACSFSFQILNPEGETVTASRSFSSRADREAAIAFVQFVARGFNFEKRSFGSDCGYYFYVTLPEEGTAENPVRLRGLQPYPTEVSAWKGAIAFARHLCYLPRYLGPPSIAAEYELGIVDESDNLIAATEAAVDRVDAFTQLNRLEPYLQIVPDGSDVRYQLRDRDDTILLESQNTFPNAEAATDSFYGELLGFLLEPGAIVSTDTAGEAPFGFDAVSLDSGTVLAIHPQTYPTAAERDAAIAHFLLAVRSLKLPVQPLSQPAAYTGQFATPAGDLLMLGARRFEIGDSEVEAADAEQRAWDEGNALVDLADDRDNFRDLDDRKRCRFTWELTNVDKDRVAATAPDTYATPEERDAAIETVRALVNDEGFHVLEHILLRPRNKGTGVCCFDELAPDATGLNLDRAIALAANLTRHFESPNFYFTLDDETGTELFRSADFATHTQRDRALRAMVFHSAAEDNDSRALWGGYELRTDADGPFFAFLDLQAETVGRSRTLADAAERLERLAWVENHLYKFAPLYNLAIVLPDCNIKDCEPKDRYDFTQVSLKRRPGFERINSSDSSQFFAHFNDPLGKVLLYSPGFASGVQRDDGIRAMIRNSIVADRFQLRQLPSGDRPLYFFLLRDELDAEIACSRLFDSAAAMQDCLLWFRRTAYLAAEKFGLDLEVPADAIPPASPADGFLPISLNVNPEPPPESSGELESDPPCCTTPYDPYSFWVGVVLPYWPERFRDPRFRGFIERTLRLEAPAHVALKICWVDVCDMRQFETAYRQWLEELQLNACEPESADLTPALNQLLQVLQDLSNVYPEATLHDCEESSPDDNPTILNQTALGTANE